MNLFFFGSERKKENIKRKEWKGLEKAGAAAEGGNFCILWAQVAENSTLLNRKNTRFRLSRISLPYRVRIKWEPKIRDHTSSAKITIYLTGTRKGEDNIAHHILMAMALITAFMEKAAECDTWFRLSLSLPFTPFFFEWRRKFPCELVSSISTLLFVSLWEEKKSNSFFLLFPYFYLCWQNLPRMVIFP